MRKLLVKYLSLDYRSESNTFQISSEIIAYIAIAIAIYAPLVGLLTLISAAILFAMGQLRPTYIVSRPRASTILYPSLAIAGYLKLLNMQGWIGVNWFLIPLIIFIITAFLSFIYLDRIAPIKWEELDDSQKIQFAEAALSGYGHLSPEQYEEYTHLKYKLS